jgi:serine/threonine protein phosphatase PrpC
MCVPVDGPGLGVPEQSQEKAAEVSLFSWLRNLWKPAANVRRGRTRHRAETTVEYPAAPAAASTMASVGTISAGNIQLRFGVVSTVGNVREHNEDNYYVPGRRRLTSAESASGGGGRESTESDIKPIGLPGLFVVADGMGGQQAGEQASSMAVEHIPRELFNRLGSSVSQDDEKLILRAIRDSVAFANQEILSLSSLDTEFTNMGTTVVLALFQKDRVYVSGIGDSRAYRLREGQIEQLTRDHSLADALGEAGTIAREEVPTHKFKNVLYLYLGSKDARGGPEEVRVMDLHPGDRFLLATDGLTGVVSDDRLAEVLRNCDDPQRAAQKLVDEALVNLSKDNITCVVIHANAA